MKKFIAFAVSAILAAGLVLSLGSCGKKDEKTIVVGASSTPHAEILEQVKDVLKDKGYTLKIKIFDDYVLPDTALEQGDLDANYFQHEPYLIDFNRQNGTHLVAVDKIHYEPLGLYGKNVTKEDYAAQGKTGKKIIIPSDGSNCTRALFVLGQEGFITLKDGVKASDSLSDKDIADKNGNEIILAEASIIPAQLKESADGTLAVINGNYALAAGLNVKDALASENAESEAALLYANIIAVKAGNENAEKIKVLVAALKTKAVYDYIVRAYSGAVLPSFSV